MVLANPDSKLIFDVLSDPDEVSNRILELRNSDYTSNQDNYPGIRIDDVQDSELFSDVSNTIINAICNAYPDIIEITEFECCLQHQSERLDYRGGIHSDSAVLVAVLYMNKNPQPGSGTLLYRNTYDRYNITTEQIHDTYQGLLDPEEHLSKYNDSFDQRDYVTFEPVYNSMCVFPGHVMHGRNKNPGSLPCVRDFFVGFVRGCKIRW